MSTRVGLYPRVSTQEQAVEGYSIGEQIDRMTKYCEAKGWIIYKIYTDAGYSGASLERPGLELLIDDAEQNKFDIALVYKLDRLSRSQKDTLTLIEDVFLPNGVDFVSMTENFDTSTPFGKAMIGILAVFAQLERDQIKDRMNTGLVARAKAGKWHGSMNSPIGYNFIDDELVVNDYEAMQIKELFGLFNMRLSVARIMEIMNERGYKTRYGTWHRQNLRPMITNRTYIGEVSYSGVWYPGIHVPILDMETFNKAQEILEERDANNKHTNRYRTTLSRLVKCGQCGNNYYVHSRLQRNGEKHATYTCAGRSSNNKKFRHLTRAERCKNKNYKVVALENMIHDQIKKLAMHPDEFPEQIMVDDNSHEREVVQKRIKEIDNKISKFTDLYAIGSLDINVVRGKIDELSEEKGKLHLRLKTLQPKDKLKKDEAVGIALSICDALENGTFDEIQALISELIEKIVIDGEDVHIFWKFA